MEMPKFNFSNPGLTEAQFQEAEAKASKGPSKFFEPGNYKLKVTDAEFHSYSKKDPTWFTVKLTFADAGGRTIRHFLLVPTTKITFNEGESKRPTFIFSKFRQFMAALGETASVDTLSKVVPKYFADFKALVGKEVDADIGYEAGYVQYRDKNEYIVIDEKGEPMKDEAGEVPVFPSRQAAEADALTRGVKVSAFCNILAFNAGEAVAPEAAPEEW